MTIKRKKDPLGNNSESSDEEVSADSGSDEDSSDDDSSDEDESEEDESDEESGKGNKRPSILGKRSNSSGAGASSNSKPRLHSDDDEASSDGEVKIVEEDYDTIDKSNIIPRGRRSAALASGLARNSGVSSSNVSKLTKNRVQRDDDSDEDAEF